MATIGGGPPRQISLYSITVAPRGSQIYLRRVRRPNTTEGVDAIDKLVLRSSKQAGRVFLVLAKGRVSELVTSS